MAKKLDEYAIEKLRVKKLREAKNKSLDDLVAQIDRVLVVASKDKSEYEVEEVQTLNEARFKVTSVLSGYTRRKARFRR